MSEIERLIDVRELADYLHTPVGWVYRQSEQGVLKSVVIKCGKYNRYRLADVIAVLQNNQSDDGNNNAS